MRGTISDIRGRRRSLSVRPAPIIPPAAVGAAVAETGEETAEETAEAAAVVAEAAEAADIDFRFPEIWLCFDG